MRLWIPSAWPTPAPVRARVPGGRRSVECVTEVGVTSAPPGSRLLRWLPEAAGAVFTVLLVTVSVHMRPSPQGRAVDWLGYGLLVAAGFATTAARRWPRTAVSVVTAVLAVFLARHYPNGPVWLAGGCSVPAPGAYFRSGVGEWQACWLVRRRCSYGLGYRPDALQGEGLAVTPLVSW